MTRFATFLFISLAIAHQSFGVDFHVSPEGNDAWSGLLQRTNAEKTDGPLVSLEGARDAVRHWKEKGAPGEPIRVLVADGVYHVSAPVVFDARDGGTEAQPVIYAAESGAHPTISGGRRISGFKPGANGVWTAEIPEVTQGKWYFEQLWVNGALATRARTPNTGWFLAMGPAGSPVAGVPLAGPLEKTVLTARPEDVASVAAVPTDELKDVNAIVYHSWNTSRHRMAGVDATSGTLQFTGPARWNFFQQEPFHRLVFENYRGALDAPGEWFLDRKGVLSYIPKPGEDMEKAEVIAPVTPRWLVFAGDAEKDKRVEHLRFRGIRFAHSQFLLPAQGWSDPQADAELGASIEADGVRDLVFENCEITATGNHALWFRRGCSDSRVDHCYLHDLCAGGVRIGETSAARSGPAGTGHITVKNCIIQGGGRYFPGAVGVFIGHSGDNDILHNDIGDFYYTAISVGWVWGFDPSVAVRNHIDWNHLHHLGWGVLSDMGAVYSLGVSPGTTVRHNRVHDISCYSYGGWGLYPDEGSTGILYEDNLVYRTQSAGFHQHYGKDNMVRNNIFAFGWEMQLRHSRVEKHLAFTFERNLVVWDQGKLLGHVDQSWWGDQVKLDHNLYWKYSQVGEESPRYIFAGKIWDAWHEMGQDLHSIIADPLFVAPETGDFHLKPGSPTPQIGFVPFDYEKAGVEGDDAWRKLADTRQYPQMSFDPPRTEVPALALHEGFEFGTVGAHPGIGHFENGCRRPAIRIVDDSPSVGKHCLLIEDGPDAAPSWNPHLYYRPHHFHNVSHISFDLKVDAAAVVAHEWRDSAVPYHTGPAFKIEKGKLTADGRELMTIPPGEWTHFETEAALGERCTGLWTLVVTIHGQEPRRFEGLKFVSPEAKKLEWLGFSSPGLEPAKWWLDEMDIRNAE